MKSILWREKRLEPSKIVCVGRNYVEHIAELGNERPLRMVLFCKPNSAIGDQLFARHLDEPLHYEAELCYLVIAGRIAGVGCGLDLTKRALQSELKTAGLPWERAKCFNGAALFSEFIPLESPDRELTIELRIDGTIRQRGSTAMMISSPNRIIREIDTFMELEDGDLIMTGTPAGVGVVEPGATFSCRVLEGEKELVQVAWVAR